MKKKQLSLACIMMFLLSGTSLAQNIPIPTDSGSKNSSSNKSNVAYLGRPNSGQISEQPNGHNTLPDANKPYHYISKKQDVRDALELFGRNLKISVTIDKNLSGEIIEIDEVLTSKAYLTKLGIEHDFVWYFDGIVLHIVDRDQLVSDTIVLKKNSGRAAIDVLLRSGVYQERFVHIGDHVSPVLYINGPKPYVDRVTQIIEAFDATEPIQLKVMRGARSPSSPANANAGPTGSGSGETPRTQGQKATDS